MKQRMLVICIAMIVTAGIFSGCSKDKDAAQPATDDTPKTDADILNQLDAYVLIAMRQDGNKNYPYIYTFSNKVVSMYKLNYLILNNRKIDIPYEVRADGVYVENELAFQVTDGKISYVDPDPDARITDLGLAGEFELIKIPETDQLAGKTFEGRFYDNHDRQVHPYN